METDRTFQELAARVDFADSKFIPLILSELLTKEEGRILLQLPAALEEIARNTGIDRDSLVQTLTTLTRKGVAVPRTRDGRTTYFFLSSALQLHDSAGIYDAGDRFRELWRKYRATEHYELCRRWEKRPQPIVRVFPYREAVAEGESVLPEEDLPAIIASARRIAVVKCACRFVMRKCDKPVEVCLVFDRSAEFAVERGVGRGISRAEAQEISWKCAAEGMIPSNLNSAKVFALCFCCPDCCILLQPMLDYGYDYVAPSRFRCRVDREQCLGCEDCVAMCHFGAIYMAEGKAVIRPERCYGCGTCAVNCPARAMKLEAVRPPEHVLSGKVTYSSV